MLSRLCEDIRDVGWFGIPRCDEQLRIKQLRFKLLLTKTEHTAIVQCGSETARPNTLSSRFGFGAFPLHTDLALKELPPNYLILCAPQPRLTKTVLWDTRAIPSETRQQAIFLLDDSRNRKYVRFEQFVGNKSFVRFNSAIMKPQNNYARDVVQLAGIAKRTTIIDWEIYQTVVVDNWRMLHGRDPSKPANSQKLHRFLGGT